MKLDNNELFSGNDLNRSEDMYDKLKKKDGHAFFLSPLGRFFMYTPAGNWLNKSPFAKDKKAGPIKYFDKKKTKTNGCPNLKHKNPN
jgi:hypothetical protein